MYQSSSKCVILTRKCQKKLFGNYQPVKLSITEKHSCKHNSVPNCPTVCSVCSTLSSFIMASVGSLPGFYIWCQHFWVENPFNEVSYTIREKRQWEKDSVCVLCVWVPHQSLGWPSLSSVPPSCLPFCCCPVWRLPPWHRARYFAAWQRRKVA